MLSAHLVGRLAMPLLLPLKYLDRPEYSKYIRYLYFSEMIFKLAVSSKLSVGSDEAIVIARVGAIQVYFHNSMSLELEV